MTRRSSDLADTLDTIRLSAPPLIPVVGALAAGAWFGYSSARGLPVDNAGWWLAGIPVASGLAFTPMARNGTEVGIIGALYRVTAVVGSAIAGPVGYGIGYIAGNVTS